MTHRLKIREEYYKAILDGSKCFEIRKNDRGFAVGDTVILKEMTDDMLYTGNEIPVEITYITDYEQKDDYIVFGFKKI